MSLRENVLFTGGFNDVVSTGFAPVDLCGIQLIGDGDGLAVHHQFLVVHSDGTRVSAVHSVVLQSNTLIQQQTKVNKI